MVTTATMMIPMIKSWVALGIPACVHLLFGTNMIRDPINVSDTVPSPPRGGRHFRSFIRWPSNGMNAMSKMLQDEHCREHDQHE